MPTATKPKTSKASHPLLNGEPITTSQGCLDFAAACAEAMPELDREATAVARQVRNGTAPDMVEAERWLMTELPVIVADLSAANTQAQSFARLYALQEAEARIEKVKQRLSALQKDWQKNPPEDDLEQRARQAVAGIYRSEIHELQDKCSPQQFEILERVHGLKAGDLFKPGELSTEKAQRDREHAFSHRRALSAQALR